MRMSRQVRHDLLATRHGSPTKHPLKKSAGSLLAVDLFSGCGGLTLGLKQAGFKVIGAVEMDPLAAETYRANHPRVSLWLKDIRRLSGHEVRTRLNLRKGELDLLAGCPPCQGFSSMRTLNGARRTDDSRNALLFEFLRFVIELEPKTIMMENVPGLTEYWRFKKFCRKLHKLGYKCRFDVLNAADFAVPQRRRRFILIATRSSIPRFAPVVLPRCTVRQAIGALPEAGHSNDDLHDLPVRHTNHILELIRDIPPDGGSRADLGPARQLNCHMRCNGFKDVYGRMPWEDVAPTITGGCFNPSKGRFLHPEKHRAVTLREAALLQSFPITYRFSLRRGKIKAAEMIGNALPPEFIRVHARGIGRTLKTGLRRRTTRNVKSTIISNFRGRGR